MELPSASLFFLLILHFKVYFVSVADSTVDDTLRLSNISFDHGSLLVCGLGVSKTILDISQKLRTVPSFQAASEQKARQIFPRPSDLIFILG